MGFNDRIENFDKFITLLSSIPNYAPNEEDLKIASLSTYRDSLKSKNAEVLLQKCPEWHFQSVLCMSSKKGELTSELIISGELSFMGKRSSVECGNN
jgi:hypothetical protein